MRKLTTMVAGLEMTEGQIMQAYYYHRKELQIRALKLVGAKVNELLKNEVLLPARTEFSAGIATFNGNLVEWVRVGDCYVLLSAPAYRAPWYRRALRALFSVFKKD